MFTIDTNILIYYASDDPDISAFLLEHLRNGTRLLLPTVVAVEFLSFPKLTGKEREFFTVLIGQLEPASLDMELALRAGELRRIYNLKLGDAIVAATALETGATLVTRNVRDFKKIPSLEIKSL